MNKYTLSVLIPARNELFVGNTVRNILENKRGKTEVIVHLDGEYELGEPIPDHPDVTVIYSPVAIGQRAGTNAACRLSRAKYVFKSDSHCAFDEGFDVKMIEAFKEVGDNVTMIPAMYNLHAFNWKCLKCTHETYQGQYPKECEKCDNMENFERVIIWKPRLSKESETYRFDTTLHFQYHGDRKHWENNDQLDVIETMSTQGSGFMLTREKYWELNICDEGMAGQAGWGQQGVEIACKTWLSGGRLLVNKRTWYSHMFRTQGGDFGFPYRISNEEQEKAREISRDTWLNNKWEGQIYPLSWLIEKFSPLPDWHDPSNKEILRTVDEAGHRFYHQRKQPTSGIIFYTDNQLNIRIAHKVQDQLRRIGLPIVSASLKPMPHFGRNVHVQKERGLDAYFTQIISALETLDTDIVFFCEHDVLYNPSHFKFTPPTKDKFYYNQNFWRIRKDGFAVRWDANQVSGLVCYREYALEWFKAKYEEFKRGMFNRSFEPGGRDPSQYEVFKSELPNVDIRHDKNLTKSKWSLADFRDKSTSLGWEESDMDHIPGWGSKLLKSLF